MQKRRRTRRSDSYVTSEKTSDCICRTVNWDTCSNVLDCVAVWYACHIAVKISFPSRHPHPRDMQRVLYPVGRIYFALYHHSAVSSCAQSVNRLSVMPVFSRVSCCRLMDAQAFPSLAGHAGMHFTVMCTSFRLETSSGHRSTDSSRARRTTQHHTSRPAAAAHRTPFVALRWLFPRSANQ